jgi:Na+/proline symporter
MLRNDANANDKDTNYIFLSFVTQYLPSGLIGLLIAVIFAASMGSTASALNSLTAVTILDVYKRSIAPRAGDRHYVIAARIITVFWGLFAIFFAEIAGKLGSLIEVVNILGSLFYGVILGVFLVAFYVKYI